MILDLFKAPENTMKQQFNEITDFIYIHFHLIYHIFRMGGNLFKSCARSLRAVDRSLSPRAAVTVGLKAFKQGKNCGDSLTLLTPQTPLIHK